MWKNKRKPMALHWKILLGMALGVIYGVIALQTNAIEFTANYIKPLGQLFINLLKLIAMPLIFFSLISGISNLKDISRLSNMGLKTLGLYIFTTVMAVTIGLIMVNLIKPGEGFSGTDEQKYMAMFADQVSQKQNAAQTVENQSPLKFFTDIVPENIVAAASDNGNMLQMIFFAVILGIAIILVPSNETKVVMDFFKGMNTIILKTIDIIMEFAPIGVFALLGAIIVDLKGDLNLFTALGWYALTVVLGLITVAFGFYPLLLKLLTKKNPVDFFKGISPAQLLAFSTSSSAATLPVTMECCEKNLKISHEVSSFVLPIGATVNMDGTSLYQAVAAVFIATVFGMDLSFSQQLTIILTATLASIGSAAVPGAGMVMLIIVLNSVGVPSEGLALIIAIDRPLDMLRTTINVTGDAVVASIIQHFDNIKKLKN